MNLFPVVDSPAVAHIFGNGFVNGDCAARSLAVVHVVADDQPCRFSMIDAELSAGIGFEVIVLQDNAFGRFHQFGTDADLSRLGPYYDFIGLGR